MLCNRGVISETLCYFFFKSLTTAKSEPEDGLSVPPNKINVIACQISLDILHQIYSGELSKNCQNW